MGIYRLRVSKIRGLFVGFPIARATIFRGYLGIAHVWKLPRSGCYNSSFFFGGLSPTP